MKKKYLYLIKMISNKTASLKKKSSLPKTLQITTRPIIKRASRSPTMSLTMKDTSYLSDNPKSLKNISYVLYKGTNSVQKVLKRITGKHFSRNEVEDALVKLGYYMIFNQQHYVKDVRRLKTKFGVPELQMPDTELELITNRSRSRTSKKTQYLRYILTAFGIAFFIQWLLMWYPLLKIFIPFFIKNVPIKDIIIKGPWNAFIRKLQRGDVNEIYEDFKWAFIQTADLYGLVVPEINSQLIISKVINAIMFNRSVSSEWAFVFSKVSDTVSFNIQIGEILVNYWIKLIRLYRSPDNIVGGGGGTQNTRLVDLAQATAGFRTIMPLLTGGFGKKSKRKVGKSKIGNRMRTIYTGSRGGKYYMSFGKKVYL